MCACRAAKTLARTWVADARTCLGWQGSGRLCQQESAAESPSGPVAVRVDGLRLDGGGHAEFIGGVPLDPGRPEGPNDCSTSKDVPDWVGQEVV